MAAKVTGQAVHVEGLKDLRRALKAAGPEATKQLKLANQEVANNVVQVAEATARGIGGIAAKVVSLGALKAANSAVASSVNLRDVLVASGGKGATFGAEFGSGRYAQFKNPSDGYFLYASIGAEREHTEELYGDAMQRVLATLEK
jgi:hypothetical protein